MSDLMKREPTTVPLTYEQPQNIWVDEYLDGKRSDFRTYYQIFLKRRRLILAAVLAAVEQEKTEMECDVILTDESCQLRIVRQ